VEWSRQRGQGTQGAVAQKKKKKKKEEENKKNKKKEEEEEKKKKKKKKKKKTGGTQSNHQASQDYNTWYLRQGKSADMEGGKWKVRLILVDATQHKANVIYLLRCNDICVRTVEVFHLCEFIVKRLTFRQLQ
jgi:flagellar motor protein MotB